MSGSDKLRSLAEEVKALPKGTDAETLIAASYSEDLVMHLLNDLEYDPADSDNAFYAHLLQISTDALLFKISEWPINLPTQKDSLNSLFSALSATGNWQRMQMLLNVYQLPPSAITSLRSGSNNLDVHVLILKNEQIDISEDLVEDRLNFLRNSKLDIKQLEYVTDDSNRANILNELANASKLEPVSLGLARTLLFCKIYRMSLVELAIELERVGISKVHGITRLQGVLILAAHYKIDVPLETYTPRYIVGMCSR